jgi:hypothetical protein
MPGKQAYRRWGCRVDLVTVGAVLLAVATGVSEALGGQRWAGVVSLVQRPFRGRQAADGDPSAVRSGEAELLTLQQAPGDKQEAVALAEVLLARTEAGAGFGRALKDWWAQGENRKRHEYGHRWNPVRAGAAGPRLRESDLWRCPALPAALPKDPARPLSKVIKNDLQFPTVVISRTIVTRRGAANV